MAVWYDRTAEVDFRWISLLIFWFWYGSVNSKSGLFLLITFRFDYFLLLRDVLMFALLERVKVLSKLWLVLLFSICLSETYLLLYNDWLFIVCSVNSVEEGCDGNSFETVASWAWYSYTDVLLAPLLAACRSDTLYELWYCIWFFFKAPR